MFKFLRKIKEYLILKRSGLFDEEYYCLQNPDVRQADVDPLWHFVSVGWKEGRNPNANFDLVNYSLSVLASQEPIGNPLIYHIKNPLKIKDSRLNESCSQSSTDQLEIVMVEEKVDNCVELENESRSQLSEAQPDPILNSDELSEFVDSAKTLYSLKEHLKEAEFYLSISHDNYTKVVGGVQNVIRMEESEILKTNYHYVHISPDPPQKKKIYETTFGDWWVVCDGKDMGLAHSEIILEWLEKESLSSIRRVIMHHTLGFGVAEIERLAKLGYLTPIFWIHDYYSACRSYHLRRNDRAYCFGPDISSNSCQICRYGEDRKLHMATFKKIFAQQNLQFCFPSNFTKDNWERITLFNNFSLESKVVPLVELKEDKVQPWEKKDKINVAFPGYPYAQKGWDSWLNLTQRFKEDDRYNFFHLSYISDQSENYRSIDVRYTPDNPHVMKEKLVIYDIDAVLIWSVVPETFSLTYYESLAAGCFIVSNPLSGNVAKTLSFSPSDGMVIDSESELMNLLTSGKLIDLVNLKNHEGKKNYLIQNLDVGYLE
ncbi:MAG: glycosyltransferase [Clostridiales bacterium]|nr:glycosyltransferase [Clostridiales bacterium]